MCFRFSTLFDKEYLIWLIQVNLKNWWVTLWMASAHQYSEKQISSYYQYPLFGWFSSVLSELFIFKKHTHWSEGRRSAAYKYRRLVISIVDAGTDGHLISIALCNCTRGLRRIFPNEGGLTQLRLRMMTFLGHVSFLSQSFIVQSEFPPFYSSALQSLPCDTIAEIRPRYIWSESVS